jgi:hypothetical protein
MPFQPGKSGNPKGRPPKKRALATALESMLKAKPAAFGGRSNKEVFAEKIVQALTTGVIEFPPLPGAADAPLPPDDTADVWEKALDEIEAPKLPPHRIYLDTPDFIRLTKVLLTHIDGPVQVSADTNINVSAGNARNATINISTRPGRTEPPALDDVPDGDDDA